MLTWTQTCRTVRQAEIRRVPMHRLCRRYDDGEADIGDVAAKISGVGLSYLELYYNKTV